MPTPAERISEFYMQGIRQQFKEYQDLQEPTIKQTLRINKDLKNVIQDLEACITNYRELLTKVPQGIEEHPAILNVKQKIREGIARVEGNLAVVRELKSKLPRTSKMDAIKHFFSIS